jgi:hypothetical protein
MRLAPQVGFRHARVITTAQFQVHEFPVAAKEEAGERIAHYILHVGFLLPSGFGGRTSDRLTRFRGY